MNSILLYILKSTVCISVLYLLFRVLMQRETSFNVSRVTLLSIVAASLMIPFVHLPQQMGPPVHVKLIPEFPENQIEIQNLPVTEDADLQLFQPQGEISPVVIKDLTIPLQTLLKYFYLAGVLIAFVLLIRNVYLVLMLFRNAAVIQKDGYRLMIVDREVPSFAFGHSIMISKDDFDLHGASIVTHEQAHIRLNHFYDLVLLELVKVFHWFNPAIYALIKDLKEIHEFQADNCTLSAGIDATGYQLLIIQKGVGPKRFALANSFNHCQIKKRIVMMNMLKTSKAWRWKVAIFLPLLAILLMAFSKTGENVNSKKVSREELFLDTVKNGTPGKLKNTVLPPQHVSIDIRQDSIYLMNKLVTLDEFRKEVPLVIKKYPQWKVIVNIFDQRNKDLKAVEDILKKEAGAKVVMIRHTQKYTPPSISEIIIPKLNTFSMQVDAKGKVLAGFDGQDNRRKLLTKMGEDYNIVFSPKELEEFSKIDIFGVPMNRMKAFLNMPAEERQKPENKVGIPYDSGNNELKNWVRKARTVNKDMRITLKGDQETSYQVIDQIIETLLDLHENRLYMALTKWATAIEIAFPSKEKPSGDQTGVKKFTQSAVMEIARSRSRVITLIPDKDNSIYYYLGTQDAKGNNPVLTKTDFSPSGIHEVLIKMNHDFSTKVEALRKKKESGELSEKDFEKQRIDILSEKNAPIVLIKPTDASTYGNLLNILDEMALCSIGRYAIIDLSGYDKELLRKSKS